MIGKRAQYVKYDEPTMWLDLQSGGIGDDYKKYLVIHNFGHALGLGHEYQRSDFWKLVKPYLDMDQMKKDLCLLDERFRDNWSSDEQFETGTCTSYDPNSIMHFWFMKERLTHGYSDRSKVEQDHDLGILSKYVAEALLEIHLHSSIPPADKPSAMDIQLLKDLYSSKEPLAVINLSQGSDSGSKQEVIHPSTSSATSTQMDLVLDFEHHGEPEHLGQIADYMIEWEGPIAEQLGLTQADVATIKAENRELRLQKRAALIKWKQRLGSHATYRNLIKVFERVGAMNSADAIRKIACIMPGENSIEYQIILRCRKSLMLAIKNNLVTISGRMMAKGLITTEASAELRNPMHSASARASTLVDLLQLKVHTNVENFKVFVDDILGADLHCRYIVDHLKSEYVKLKAERESGVVEQQGQTKSNSTGAANPVTDTATGGNILSSADLKGLYSQLIHHAARWREIGTHLGFYQPELHAIENNPVLLMEAPDSWLRAMLTEWCQWEPGDSRGSKEYATLEALKLALDKTGLRRAAAELHLGGSGDENEPTEACGKQDLFEDMGMDIGQPISTGDQFNMANLGEEAKKMINKWVDRSKSLNIVIFGRSGTGKSSLVNTLFNENVAKEGSGLFVETRVMMNNFIQTVNGVLMTIWDTPGLKDPFFDDTVILQEIKDKCGVHNIDLIIYCSRFDQTRLAQDDVDCIRDITSAFGDGIWKKTLLVLTFADKTSVPLSFTTQSLQAYFISRESQWRETFHDVIKKNVRPVKYHASKIDSIPVLPVCTKGVPLPDGRNWFGDFWAACLSQVRLFTIPALIRVAQDRVKDEINDTIIEIVGQRLSEIGDRIAQVLEDEMHTDSSVEHKTLPRIVATAQWSDFLIKAIQQTAQ